MNKVLAILFVVVSLGLIQNPFSSNENEGQVFGDSLIILQPKPEHKEETFVIINLLNRFHYNKLVFGDSISSIVFDNYFESLDPSKAYFIKSDVEYFEKYRKALDDHLPEGNLDFGYQLFSVYRERALNRIEKIYEQLKIEPDFTVSDYLETDRKKIDWLSTHEELDNRWIKVIKNQAISLKMAGKEWSEISEILTKRYQRIEKALYQFNSEDVYQAYMNALTSAYDPHTDYFSPIAKENFQIDMSLSLEGIGAQLTQQLDYTKIADIIPGGPAYKSQELEKDDKIIGVAQGDDSEFVDVIGWRLDEVVQKIRGPKGTVVRLQVIKNNKDVNSLPDTIRLVRDKIKLEKAAAKAEIFNIKEGNDSYNMGVVTLPSFYIDFDEKRRGVKDYKSTTRDVRYLIDSISKYDLDGLLIDLRYNGGGSLEEAISLTGLFIPKGPVVQVKNSDTSVDVMEDMDNGKVFYDGPLGVLINRYSASASEIFSGAIQDYKRGIVIGENSFGKGTVQNLIDIGRYMRHEGEPLGQLKMTLAKFYRVTGSSTQRIGVAPDISFPTPYQDEVFGEASRPTALPWDEIASSKFQSTDVITSKMIGKLQNEYNKHLKEDKSLIDLVADIEKAKERMDETALSLNLEERKQQEKDADSDDDELNATIDNGDSLVEKAEIDKLDKDVYLKEGLRLLAELSEYKMKK